jgi:hypothetical protein
MGRQQFVNEKVACGAFEPVDELLAVMALYSGFRGRFAHKIWGLRTGIHVTKSLAGYGFSDHDG